MAPPCACTRGGSSFGFGRESVAWPRMTAARRSGAAARPRRRVRAKSVRREFNVLLERDDDGWYVGTVPELRGCHTQARSLDALMTRIREAIELCLEAGDSDGSREFVGLQRISLRR